MSVTFRVEGMTCGHCEQAVRSALGRVTDVTSIDVDLVTGVVTVSRLADVEAAVEAIENCGYDVDRTAIARGGD